VRAEKKVKAKKDEGVHFGPLNITKTQEKRRSRKESFRKNGKKKQKKTGKNGKNDAV